MKFQPGQWLDTFIPGLPKAGGFTITSTPGQARPNKTAPPYLELAVQKSANPPAQWLWKPEPDILGSELMVRVGGSFVWPPPHLDPDRIERLVLVAGGVGINPLISIFSHLISIHESQRPKEIHFLYGTKTPTSDMDPHTILFLTRLIDLVAAAADPKNVTLSLYLTNTGYGDGERIEHGKLPNRTFAKRIGKTDLVGALDGWRQGSASGRKGTVCYVCGPPKMTDEFVDVLRAQDGMDEERVLCEKWW